MTSQMIAYHFVGATLRDGRQVPPDGEWLEHSGTLVMCESGLHASPTPFEALQYAPGNVLCEVEMTRRGFAGNAEDVFSSTEKLDDGKR